MYLHSQHDQQNGPGFEVLMWGDRLISDTKLTCISDMSWQCVVTLLAEGSWNRLEARLSFILFSVVILIPMVISAQVPIIAMDLEQPDET